MEKPATRAVPAVGGSSVVSILIVVVLPAPLEPRRPKISPAWTDSVSPSTAVKSPKRRVNDSSSRMVLFMSQVGGWMNRTDDWFPRVVIVVAGCLRLRFQFGFAAQVLPGRLSFEFSGNRGNRAILDRTQTPSPARVFADDGGTGSRGRVRHGWSVHRGMHRMWGGEIAMGSCPAAFTWSWMGAAMEQWFLAEAACGMFIQPSFTTILPMF